jgi:transposase
MWTPRNRHRYDRSKLRYPSDLTEEEWAHVAPLIPPAKRGGNKRTVEVREVVNGLMYVLSTGCQWRAIPKDLPPRSTLHDYLELWEWDGTLARLHHALYVKCREQVSREASPTAAIIDSQSVKSAEKGGPRSTGTATMRARRSRARSGICLSTPKVFCCARSSMPPTFRIATAAYCSWQACSACSRSCANSTPMADIRGRHSRRPWPGCCGASRLYRTRFFGHKFVMLQP